MKSSQGVFTGGHLERGAMLRAGLGEHQRARVEFQNGERSFGSGLRSARTPVETAGDHQMEHQPVAALEAYGDALANAANVADRLAVNGFDRRGGGAQQKRAADRDSIERMAEESLAQRFDIDRNVREFRHTDLLWRSRGKYLLSRARALKILALRSHP